MRKERNESKAKERRMKELDFSLQQVNDYPLSDKNLVVNPQTIPLTVNDLPFKEIENI